jgi:hypothetical protein
VPATASATQSELHGATATASGPGDTRVGSIELAIPRLRSGSYFPSFLEPRRRSEQGPGGGRPPRPRSTACRPARSIGWWRPSAWRASPRTRCPGSAKAWTSRSPPSASGLWRAPTPTCGWTPRSRRSAPAVEWSTGRWWWLMAWTPPANARSSASTWARPRPKRSGGSSGGPAAAGGRDRPAGLLRLPG